MAGCSPLLTAGAPAPIGQYKVQRDSKDYNAVAQCYNVTKIIGCIHVVSLCGYLIAMYEIKSIVLQ